MGYEKRGMALKRDFTPMGHGGGGPPFLPDRPTASFRKCEDQSFVRSEPQRSLQYLSVSVLKHRETLRERTTPPRQQRAGSRQAPRTQ